MVRRLAFSVPDAARSDHAVSRLRALTQTHGGTWLRAQDGRPGRHWPAAVGSAATRLVPAPESSVFRPVDGHMALCTTPGQNGGFGLEALARGDQPWSGALIWAACEAPAQTLLAMRPQASGNNLFLAQTRADTLTLRDDDATVALDTPTGLNGSLSEGWCITLIAVRPGRVSLAAFGNPFEHAQGYVPAPGPVRPLIGARKHKPGLHKSLGAAAVREVWLWPGLDLAGPDRAASELLGALETFCLWEIEP